MGAAGKITALLANVHEMFNLCHMARIDISPSPPQMQPGQLLARGVCRHLATYGMACVEELVPTRGLRVDVMALGPKGEIWVVECKSSRADFIGDAKWQGYLEWCDRFFFAVPSDFPDEILPSDEGLIIADGFGAEVIRPAEPRKLAAARRKAQTIRLARVAAQRLREAHDPGVARLIGGGKDDAG